MRRSYWIAGTIALLAAGWLASGMLFKPDEPARSIPAVSAEAAQLANYAAGVEVGKPGVATVSPEEVLAVHEERFDQLGRLRRGGVI